MKQRMKPAPMLLTTAAVVALVTSALLVTPAGLITGATTGGTLGSGPAAAGFHSSTFHFRWEAPAALEGDFVAVLQLKATTETFCTWDSGGEGEVVDDDPSILFWDESMDENGGRTLFIFANTHQPVHAQAVGLADTYDAVGVQEDGNWWTGHSAGSRFDETLSITTAAFGVKNRPGAPVEHPLFIDLGCDNPVELSLLAGRNPVDFTQQRLTDDGVGGEVDPPVDKWRTSVYLDATKQARFDTELVRLMARFTQRLDSEGPGQVESELSLHHPAGTATWSFPADAGFFPWHMQMRFDGGPGDYTLELDHKAILRDSQLWGVLVGADPVESLDDVV